jgi:hypothetical protein
VADVFVDGTASGRSPQPHLALRPGRHHITFVLGSARTSIDVVVRDGETVPAIVRFDARQLAESSVREVQRLPCKPSVDDVDGVADPFNRKPCGP